MVSKRVTHRYFVKRSWQLHGTWCIAQGRVTDSSQIKPPYDKGFDAENQNGYIKTMTHATSIYDNDSNNPKENDRGTAEECEKGVRVKIILKSNFFFNHHLSA